MGPDFVAYSLQQSHAVICLCKVLTYNIFVPRLSQVIMELTGSFDLNKPILLGAVVAFAFSRKFGLNIYDSGK